MHVLASQTFLEDLAMVLCVAAVTLWISFNNFCRVHETLRQTPAMALSVTDHIWSIGELIKEAMDSSDVPPLEPPMIVREKHQPIKSRAQRLIRGGKR